MMAVDFCDYFWGEKHDGFNVIYQVTLSLSNNIRDKMPLYWILILAEHESRPCGSQGPDRCCKGDGAHARKLCKGLHEKSNNSNNNHPNSSNQSPSFRCTLESASNWGQISRLVVSSLCLPPSKPPQRSLLPFTRPPSPRWHIHKMDEKTLKVLQITSVRYAVKRHFRFRSSLLLVSDHFARRWMTLLKTWFATVRSFTKNTSRSRWWIHKNLKQKHYDPFF